MENNSDADVLLVFMVIVILCIIYFLPTIIAAIRKHHYLWVIFGINFIFGLSGIGYFIALIWAVWPRNTAVLDVIINDPTSNSANAGREIYGKMGRNVRAFTEARNDQVTIPPGTLAHNIIFKDSRTRIYVHVNEQVKGPYTTDQIHRLLKNGKITINYLVCQEGTETWQPLSSFLK